MHDNVIIRASSRSDTGAIARIAEATGLFPPAMLDDMIAGYLNQSKSDKWLSATVNNEVVGFGFCEPERMTEGTWNLLAIGTLPQHQSRGVGAKLIAHLEALLAEEGQRILLVETIDAPEFVRTRAFYLAQKFVEEARIREFYEAGADKLVFWKKLA